MSTRNQMKQILLFFNPRSRALMRFNRFICIKTVIGSLYPLAFLAQENLTTHGDPLLSNCFINFAIKMQEIADDFVMSNDNFSSNSMIT